MTMGYSLPAEAAATVGQTGGSWNSGEVRGAAAWRTETQLREQKGKERTGPLIPHWLPSSTSGYSPFEAQPWAERESGRSALSDVKQEKDHSGSEGKQEDML